MRDLPTYDGASNSSLTSSMTPTKANAASNAMASRRDHDWMESRGEEQEATTSGMPPPTASDPQSSVRDGYEVDLQSSFNDSFGSDDDLEQLNTSPNFDKLIQDELDDIIDHVVRWSRTRY